MKERDDKVDGWIGIAKVGWFSVHLNTDHSHMFSLIYSALHAS